MILKQYLSIFNSDQVNAYGIRMPVGTLASALEQGWFSGQPLFLSHDHHRLEGWTRTLGLYLEPGLARLTGICCLPENDAEADQLKELVYGHFGRQIARHVDPYQAELKKKLEPFLVGDEEPIFMDAAALRGDRLAARTFSDIFDSCDKDGLVVLKDLHAVAPGVYERGGLLFFASAYLRRSLSRLNTLNDALLDRLHAIVSNPGLTVKVRLDPDVVGLASTHHIPLEFAYWWGPRFDDDLQSIPPGITQHSADDMQRIFSGVSRTEFWWHEQNDLKTLECEEVLDIPSMGVGRDSYGCRYAHSIVDPNTKVPFHLDGAIRLYDENTMLERLDKTMYTMGRHSEYTKLWRVDGPIPIPLWKELITHHFRDNELVGEYLGGQDDSGHVRPSVVDASTDPIYRFVPCNMSAGDGVRISIAYHLPSKEDGESTELIPLDTCGTADSRTHYVEADTFEVIKILRRDGIEVSVPEGVLRLAFEDTSINFSLILHRGSTALATAAQTLNTMHNLCDAWVARGDDRIVSFVIGVEYDDRVVYFSYAGHVVDLQRFFVAFGTPLPATPADVGEWAESALNHLGTLFTPRWDIPQLSHMMKQSGILQFDRKSIDRAFYTRGWSEDDRPAIHFGIPRSEAELIALLDAEQITWADIWIVNRSTCSVCKNDYLACNCSKYLDQPVHQEMKDVELCDLFWTNRPASAHELLILDDDSAQA